jgi:hypothetical protein
VCREWRGRLGVAAGTGSAPRHWRNKTAAAAAAAVSSLVQQQEQQQQQDATLPTCKRTELILRLLGLDGMLILRISPNLSTISQHNNLGDLGEKPGESLASTANRDANTFSSVCVEALYISCTIPPDCLRHLYATSSKRPLRLERLAHQAQKANAAVSSSRFTLFLESCAIYDLILCCYENYYDVKPIKRRCGALSPCSFGARMWSKGRGFHCDVTFR